MNELRFYCPILNVAIEWYGANSFSVYNENEICVDCFTVIKSDNKKWTKSEAKKIIMNRFDQMSKGEI